MKKSLIIGMCYVAISFGCDNGLQDISYQELKLNDTLYLPLNECVFDPTNKSTICFEAVVTDSRCPIGLICIWGGEAIMKFSHTTKNGRVSFIELHSITRDIVFKDYKISYLELIPYPHIDDRDEKRDYRAKVVINKL